MSSVTAVDGVKMGNRGAQEGGLERFVRACIGGHEIEELILRDAARQRKIAGQLRSAHRESQRRAAGEAAVKIRQAARCGLWSALISAGVQIGVAAACWALEPASDLTRSGGGLEKAADPLWKKLARGGLQALGTFIDKYTPYLTEAQADAQARAGELQTESSIRGQQAAEDSDWLRDIKELEQKLISHLEKTIELEQQTRKTVIDRMGS